MRLRALSLIAALLPGACALAQSGVPQRGETVAVSPAVAIRFADLPAAAPGSAAAQVRAAQPRIPRPLTGDAPAPAAADDRPAAAAPEFPAVAPPPLSASFQALDDDNSFIPPDTDGAVGPNHLVVALNSQVRIQDKSGATLSTTTLASLFSALGHSGTHYAPKVIYDSLAGRFILTDAVDPSFSTSAVELAVSKTSDPTGGWWLYSLDADSFNSLYADAPLSGFNKDWIVIQSNLFNNSSGNWSGTHVDVLNKTAYYAGTGSGFSRFTRTVGDNDFSMQPALTYSATLATEYLLEEWNGSSAQEGILYVTGPVGAETLTAGALIAMPQGAWSEAPASINFAPQLGTASRIDTGDTRMRSAVYRNGQLWGAHTLFLPSSSPTRASIQWFSLNPLTSAVNQSGRIDDPAGGRFFAYPSLAVNQYNDTLIGYSRFSSSQYASGNYTARFNYDAAGALRDDTVYKTGQAPYFKDFGGGDNSWGNYSMSAVDPTDDITMWTIQEYAATNFSGADHWGTWWGKLTLDCAGKANGTPCNSDGLCSSGPKSCQTGVCVGTAPVVCTSPDSCHTPGTCSPSTGVCSAPVIKPNGSACSDGNGCTAGDTCQSGSCASGPPVSCTQLDQCHVAGVCNPGTGVCSNPPKADGSPCNDGTACTTNDLCTTGACGGTRISAPNDVHNQLRLAKSGASGIQALWTTVVPDAVTTHFHIYRAATPAAAFPASWPLQTPEPPSPGYLPASAVSWIDNAASGAGLFYDLRSANACEDISP